MKVSFNINYYTVWGQKLYIVGSIPELGNWEPALSLEMSYSGDGNWTLELELPDSTTLIEYRYLITIDNKQVFEKWERNHCFIPSKTNKHYILFDHWQNCPSDLAFYSSAFTKNLFAHSHPKTTNRYCKKKIILKVYAPKVLKDQCLAISGNQDFLGNWVPEKALLADDSTFPEWNIELDATQIQYPLEYKFLIVDKKSKNAIQWETEENRTFYFPSQNEDDSIIISGLYFREYQANWKCAGCVIPVFSLRSEQSFGVGDLRDLYLFIDWTRHTNQHIIQVLPMNDTTITHTWIDSYPYSAISIYALHPMYISLSWMGSLNDLSKNEFFKQKQQELNNKDYVDYESVIRYKLQYCRLFFEQEKEIILQSTEYKLFFSQNRTWLLPYAAYSYLRDKFGTADFNNWNGYSNYNKNKIKELCKEKSEVYLEISFYYFLQFILHSQFKMVSNYARSNEVVLKGDLPIGVNRYSVEAWTEPQYFNMNGQAGAPPDDFSANGQNWMFPTYNWDIIEKDHFSWWKKRFQNLGEYFDCFRIDHILGFFRIWEIPKEYVQGLCGHFNPALPFSKEDIEKYGLPFNENRFTTPHINQQFLNDLFGDDTDKVKDAYLAQSSSNHFVLKHFCNTQRKIEKIFENQTDEASLRIKNGLYSIANEVLFVRDPRETDKFHPRISASQSYLYKELNDSDKSAFDRLYWDFFYHRHNDFWKAQAYRRLTPLISCTEMLICGEDLGMIPDSVPEVMHQLQIFSLEIERMPKTSLQEFTDLKHIPYYSVCTTSTHDMSPLRNWWKEDRNKIQRYYNNVLHREGIAPEDCSAEIAEQIITNHLNSPAMLAIIPLQDWLAIDDSLKRKDIESERINVPANSSHYWRYRMHITIEKLIEADKLNKKIKALLAKTGRQ